MFAFSRLGLIMFAFSRLGLIVCAFSRQVEVMACPKGCTNGGGQVRKQPLESVNRNFDEWFGGESMEEVTPKPFTLHPIP